jgi:hypothetical protein
MATTLHALSLAARILTDTLFSTSPASSSASRKETVHARPSPPPCRR